MDHAIRCPKCIFYERSYNAPLGKIIRNPYADLTKAVYDDCNACNATGYVPSVVLDSIKRSFPKRYAEIVANLRWSRDHFSFMLGDLYVGVEVSGYIHT